MDTDKHLYASLRGRQTQIHLSSWWINALALEGGLSQAQTHAEKLITLLADLNNTDLPLDPNEYVIDTDTLRDTITILSQLLTIARDG